MKIFIILQNKENHKSRNVSNVLLGTSEWWLEQMGELCYRARLLCELLGW